MEKSNKELLKEFKEVVQPVKEWANKNLNPNQEIVIEHGRARVLSVEMGVPLEVQD